MPAPHKAPAASNRGSSSEDSATVRLKKHYASDLVMLRTLFSDWSDEDLLYTLEECGGDTDLAIARISEGHAEQWSSVAKKDKKASTSTSSSDKKDITAAITESINSTPVHVRDGPRSASARGGRGARGRGGYRGSGRGGYANGAPRGRSAPSRDSREQRPEATSTAQQDSVAQDGADAVTSAPAVAPVEQPKTAPVAKPAAAPASAPAPKPVAQEKPVSRIIPKGSTTSWASLLKTEPPKPAPVSQPVVQQQPVVPPSPPKPAKQAVSPAVAPVVANVNATTSPISPPTAVSKPSPVGAAPVASPQQTAATVAATTGVIGSMPKLPPGLKAPTASPGATPAAPAAAQAKKVERAPLKQDAAVVMPKSMVENVASVGVKFGSLNIGTTSPVAEEKQVKPAEKDHSPVAAATTSYGSTYQQFPQASPVENVSQTAVNTGFSAYNARESLMGYYDQSSNFQQQLKESVGQSAQSQAPAQQAPVSQPSPQTVPAQPVAQPTQQQAQPAQQQPQQSVTSSIQQQIQQPVVPQAQMAPYYFYYPQHGFPMGYNTQSYTQPNLGYGFAQPAVASPGSVGVKGGFGFPGHQLPLAGQQVSTSTPSATAGAMSSSPVSSSNATGNAVQTSTKTQQHQQQPANAAPYMGMYGMNMMGGYGMNMIQMGFEDPSVAAAATGNAFNPLDQTKGLGQTASTSGFGLRDYKHNQYDKSIGASALNPMTSTSSAATSGVTGSTSNTTNTAAAATNAAPSNYYGMPQMGYAAFGQYSGQGQAAAAMYPGNQFGNQAQYQRAQGYGQGWGSQM